MKTIYDVRQLLKRFGTIIYIGDRTADLELMESEIKELYQLQCIGTEEYQKALLLLRKEARRLSEQKGES
ncbi:YqgQ family protein [Lentibacillus amyloliquefaciens]|uniref:Cytosolic protein n=1 Tax=Lentibacillus amyloliquefaciens TaxID=1472767 RepID=A0A0U3W4G8_9BACI|nr:YqgQ family protein [Lentibacillus amyloliquefaciens]ALX48080.1 cytosolic protein [Lentibacillus amyloliquefaciens]